MTSLTEHNQWWFNQDGRKVVIDGIAHVLKVKSYLASYPYTHEVIDVAAVPVNKHTKYYQDIKRELHDDWSTDVLASSIELQSEIQQQLRGR